MPHPVHSISIQGSFCATISSVLVPRQDRLTRLLPHRSEPSPIQKSPLFSLSHSSIPIISREQPSRSGSRGPGRVEQWIEDQRGGDLDPNLLSPMPRHSDTIVHTRRVTPVPPRSSGLRQDSSDFVFVDDDQVSTSENFEWQPVF